MKDVVDENRLSIARDAAINCAICLHEAGRFLTDTLIALMKQWEQGESPESEDDSPLWDLLNDVLANCEPVLDEWYLANTAEVSDAILLATPKSSKPIKAMELEFATTHRAVGGLMEVLCKTIGILLDRERMSGFTEDARRQLLIGMLPGLIESELRQSIDREWRDAVSQAAVRASVPVQENAAEVVKHSASGEEQATAGSGKVDSLESPNEDLPRINLELNQVRFNGICHDVTADGAMLISELVKSYPQPFSASSIFTKPARVKNSLPDVLKELIEAQSGKGYRLVLE